MENKTCSYEDCHETLISPHDESLCVFHAPVDKKGITVGEFNELIWQRINSKCLNFRGFIFPGDISFRGRCRKEGGPIVFAQDVNFLAAQFEGETDFRDAQFEGDADFSDSVFSGIADFNNVHFLKGTNFQDARFASIARFLGACLKGDSFFSNARFLDRVYFAKTRFENAHFKGAVFARYSKFNEIEVAGLANFGSSRFDELADFHKARFSGLTMLDAASFTGGIDFSGTRFSGGANFCNTHFDHNVKFEENRIEGKLLFEEISLGDKVRFYFRSPSLKSARIVADPSFLASVVFEKVLFRPFYTYFESVRFSLDGEISSKPIFIFRYCELKDVYFTNNDMTLFSFYKSSFDQARFISSTWDLLPDHVFFGKIRFKRKNIIPEDIFIKGIRPPHYDRDTMDQLKARFMLEDLTNFDEVASLYRRMKTALDNTKDYQQASWFYFNEFEMKRLALKDQIEIGRPAWRILQWQPCIWAYKQLKKIFSRYRLYCFYRLFAGYGEKPLWSFWWFIGFAIIFGVLHFFSGLDPTGGGSPIRFREYSSLAQFLSWDFLRAIGNCLVFSFSRAIPVTYFGVSVSRYWDTGPYGQIITFFNSLILLILVIFIGVGLKRHFRRF